MNATIKIYPDREMLALDMAEALDAATIRSGIIQGCEIKPQSGNLEISSGRLMIKGRLAVVSQGTIEAPSVSTTKKGMFVCAVCDLSQNGSDESDEDIEPITLEIMSKTDYDNIADHMSAEDFNASNGQWIVKLGTVTVAPDGTVSDWQAIANAASPSKVNNKSYVDDGDAKVQADLNAQKKEEYEDTQKLALWRKHILNRVHDNNKFKTWTINYPHFTIKAGESKIVTIPVITYGEVYTYSNGKVTHANKYGENATKSKYKKTLYSYPDYRNPKKNITPSNPEIRSSFHTLATQGPSAMHPTGIVGLTITNSDNGGKNRQRCRIQGWSFSSTRAFITLYMDPDVTIKDKDNKELYKTEYKQAIVDVNVTLSYVQEE